MISFQSVRKRQFNFTKRDVVFHATRRSARLTQTRISNQPVIVGLEFIRGLATIYAESTMAPSAHPRFECSTWGGGSIFLCRSS